MTGPNRPFVTWLMRAIGLLAVGLGAAGVVLPLLPTTPFLLLAAFCFARSSPRFYSWLLTHPLFGDSIRAYREGRGMTRNHKSAVLLLLWLTISASALFAVSAVWLRVLLGVIATAVTAHILYIPTAAVKRKK